MTRPRIVYVDHVARISGAEIALVRLISALGDQVDPHVVLGEDGPLVARLRAVGATVHILPMHPAARDVRKDSLGGRLQVAAVVRTALYVLRLRRVLRQLKPEVLHCNSLKACVYGGLAGRLAGVPVLWHVRDRIADDYLPGLAVRVVRLLARILPSALIANSESTRQTLLGVGSSTVIYNAVVPDSVVRLAPSPRERQDGCFTVGVVGRLAPWKGQDVFLRAFAQAFPDGPERARLVGSAMFGEGAFEEQLHDLAVELGIDDRLELRGFRDDVEAELAELDVLVHCSRTPEPFGQVIIEGLAAGIPVIASGAGGPAEILTDEVDGLLSSPGDVGELAAALERLRDDVGLRQRLAEQGPLSAQRFSPSVLAERLLAVYGLLVPRSQSPHRCRASSA